MHRTCEWPDTEILSPLHLSIQPIWRPYSTRICLSFLCIFFGQHSLSNPSSQAGSASLPPPSSSQARSTSLPPPLPSASESIDQTSKNRYLPYAGQLQSQEPTIHPSRRSKILHLPKPAEATSYPASPLTGTIPAPSHSISGIPQADAALFLLERHEDNGERLSRWRNT